MERTKAHMRVFVASTVRYWRIYLSSDFYVNRTADAETVENCNMLVKTKRHTILPEIVKPLKVSQLQYSLCLL